MDENQLLKSENIPKEESTVNEELIKFPREWSFWESYKAKGEQLEYQNSMKSIFNFDNWIAFWQFWNKYPGSEANKLFFDGNTIKYYFKEKYRITAMNVFVKGVQPAWEDKQNTGGKYLQLEYKIDSEIDKFFAAVNEAWTKLILNTAAQNYEGSEHVNGIRFIDKTQFDRGRIIMFRLEIWVKPGVKAEAIEKLKTYSKEVLGCGQVEVKNI